jgi:hypothetical protein
MWPTKIHGGQSKRPQRDLVRHKRPTFLGLFVRSLYQCVSDAVLPLCWSHAITSQGEKTHFAINSDRTQGAESPEHRGVLEGTVVAPQPPTPSSPRSRPRPLCPGPLSLRGVFCLRLYASWARHIKGGMQVDSHPFAQRVCLQVLYHVLLYPFAQRVCLQSRLSSLPLHLSSAFNRL